jgi:hypothetical protein
MSRCSHCNGGEVECYDCYYTGIDGGAQLILKAFTDSLPGEVAVAFNNNSLVQWSIGPLMDWVAQYKDGLFIPKVKIHSHNSYFEADYEFDFGQDVIRDKQKALQDASLLLMTDRSRYE